jgi:hypothetical protein
MPGSICSSIQTRGKPAVTTVPLPISLSRSNVPPATRARSFIMTLPK